MTQPAPHEVTRLVQALARGDQTPAEQLLPLVYDELRRLAAHFIKSERPGHTLQPTALVHEAFLKLVQQRDIDWKGRAHFLALAGTAMRRLLVDHARRRAAVKRGDGAAQRADTLALDSAIAPRGIEVIELLALDDALLKLAAQMPRAARGVELRFFGGLTIAETAEALGVSHTTVEDEWTFSRAWLARELGGVRE